MTIARTKLDHSWEQIISGDRWNYWMETSNVHFSALIKGTRDEEMVEEFKKEVLQDYFAWQEHVW